eukprot:scaffold104680_cov23-Tisochrysis_lutea.AAC.3
MASRRFTGDAGDMASRSSRQAHLQQIRAGAVEDARSSQTQRRRVARGVDAIAAGLHTNELHLLVGDKGMEHANGVRAAANASNHGIGQTADFVEHLWAGKHGGWVGSGGGGGGTGSAEFGLNIGAPDALHFPIVVSAVCTAIGMPNGRPRHQTHSSDVGARDTAEASTLRLPLMCARLKVHLLASLIANDSLEVAHNCWEGVRADGRSDEVVRGGHVGDPVTHRLVDGVLQRRGTRCNRNDGGAEHLHAEDIEGLARHVLGSHVHNALEVEQGAHGGGGHAVLTCACLSDDPLLAEALSE